MTERKHRRIFRDEHGDGPYTCAYALCPDPTMRVLEVVHHDDEDKTNNDIRNLLAMHWSCHSKHHHFGVIHSDDTRTKISRTKRGVSQGPLSAAHKINIGNANRGKRRTPEQRLRIGDGVRLGQARVRQERTS